MSVLPEAIRRCVIDLDDGTDARQAGAEAILRAARNETSGRCWYPAYGVPERPYLSLFCHL
jgi:hypothetical protein